MKNCEKNAIIYFLNKRSDGLYQWFSNFCRCDAFGNICWACDALDVNKDMYHQSFIF